MDKQETVKNLLEKKEKLSKKLASLKEKFEEEKDNEEAWPGHSSTFLQDLQQEYQLTIILLEDTEKALKKLQS